MEQYQIELADATKRISAIGKDANAFSFDMAYIPPDPDGGGMFTLMYEIFATHKPTQKSLKLIGGIGWKWVDHFESALKEGFFD